MDLEFIRETFFLTLKGVPVTLSILIMAIGLSFLPALYMALGQIHKVPGVKFFSTLYLAFIRSTPPILMILFFYSFLPSFFNNLTKQFNVGINVFDINPIVYAFLIYALMTTATLAEILRSAILTVDKGQFEAALAIGLTPSQTYCRIVLPQAFKSALPNICNLVITIVKGTSLVFVMTVKDITAIAKIQAAYGYHYFEAYLVIFLVYIIVCGSLQLGFNLLEKRLVLI